MKKIQLIILFVAFTTALLGQAKLQTPEEFLGYALGDRFTRHHRVVEYFKHVDELMPNVKVMQYGETYEHRPLIYTVITSPENFNHLEEIRTENLRRSWSEGGTSRYKLPIVWLSYNVHGNEANSMEASMKTLFELVNPDNLKSKEWLKNTVVIIDPCINPDGRDRYANFYNQYGNFPPNGDPQARENREHWPRGRANHYLFDLNRDWAWESQIESQARIKIYNAWLPHIHVDFHEQSPNNPYYFAPAALPYHEVVTPWQRAFQVTIGKNHAKYFDEQGWLYFTKERFDLFYPSYGDTYPTFSGAIGMTYEKAGGVGLTYTTDVGDPITLKDRLTHHHTTGMSTVEVASENAVRLVDEFEKYFKELNTNPTYPYKSYVIKSTNNRDKINNLTEWMNTHSIRYGHPTLSKASRGFDYTTQTVSNFNLNRDDIVINIYQPKGRFITTLFEPQSKLTDSATYDITAWNLFYANGLTAYALNEKILVGQDYQPKQAIEEAVISKPYAYLFKYESINDVEFLGALMQAGVKVRSAEKSFTSGGLTFEPGSLIVTRRNNESVQDFDNTVQTLAGKYGRHLFTATTGFVEKGIDFGSGDVNYLKAPRVALLGGDQTSSQSHGQIWHFFEQQIHYPVTIIGTDYMTNVDLKKYDVFIVPDGSYKLFDETTLTKMQDWVSEGGRLILVEGSVRSFADKKGFGLKEYASEEKKQEAEKAAKEKNELVKYDEADRKDLSNAIYGAIYKTTLDKSHPLAFGLDSYYSLKTNTLRFDYLEEGWNVAVLKGQVKPVMGFAGYKANKKIANSLVFGVEDKGRGQIVYLIDNPLYRSFWENGKIIFANAVFMVGQ